MKHSILSDKKPDRLRLWAIAFWLIAWQLLSMIVGHEILLASPLSVAGRFFALIFTQSFWQTLSFSLLRILGGFLLGCVSGVILAALSAAFRRIRELIAPFVAVIRAIPVASFVIVALIWVPSRNLALLISALIVWPVVYANVLSGIEETDKKLLEMAHIFRLSGMKRILYIYIPQSLPYFRAAVVASMGLAWKSGVAAEVIGIPSGSIGEALYRAKIYLMTPDLFAWTIALVAASLICEKLFLRLVDIAIAGIERM